MSLSFPYYDIILTYCMTTTSSIDFSLVCCCCFRFSLSFRRVNKVAGREKAQCGLRRQWKTNGPSSRPSPLSPPQSRKRRGEEVASSRIETTVASSWYWSERHFVRDVRLHWEKKRRNISGKVRNTQLERQTDRPLAKTFRRREERSYFYPQVFLKGQRQVSCVIGLTYSIRNFD